MIGTTPLTREDPDLAGHGDRDALAGGWIWGGSACMRLAGLSQRPAETAPPSRSVACVPLTWFHCCSTQLSPYAPLTCESSSTNCSISCRLSMRKAP